ncbi:MAG: LD-carboxypeptidase [Gammaproteobacteria bacterium]
MKRRTFVSGVMSAGVLSTATTISALSAASNKTISPTAHPIGGIGQHQQRFARALKPGMTVGVVAPSSNAFEDDDIRFALDIVSSLGFKPKPGRHLFKRYGYLAGTDAQRAADLNAMFVDDEVDAIFCARGGYGAMRILPMLDYTAIAANPKVLLGYSDITALISAIDRHAGLITFHGPIATQQYTPYTYQSFQDTLLLHKRGIEVGAPPPFEAGPGRAERKNRLQTIVAGSAEGHLVGGNLSLISALMGTPYEPRFDGGILVLEDVDEAPYRVDRMLTQLRLAGVFERISGLVLGKFTDYSVGGPSLSMGRVFEDLCGDIAIPVLRGLMIGHVKDQAVLPMGAMAHLDSSARTLRVTGQYLVT